MMIIHDNDADDNDDIINDDDNDDSINDDDDDNDTGSLPLTFSVMYNN